MVFYATGWSIWLYRNDIVFNGKKANTEEVVSLIKLRIAWWTKAKWPNIKETVMDIYRQPNFVDTGKGTTRMRDMAKWCAPSKGILKFNVDEAVKGKPGPGGIGGLLRDENGNTLVEFSKDVGVCDSNEAEVYAIKEALLIFCSSRWAETHGLIIESDSTNAVLWMSSPSEASWRVRKFAVQAAMHAKKLINFQIQHVPREANVEADSLAKAGVGRIVPWLRLAEEDSMI